MKAVSIDIIQTEELRIKADEVEPKKYVTWSIAANMRVTGDGKGRQKPKFYFQ